MQLRFLKLQYCTGLSIEIFSGLYVPYWFYGHPWTSTFWSYIPFSSSSFLSPECSKKDPFCCPIAVEVNISKLLLTQQFTSLPLSFSPCYTSLSKSSIHFHSWCFFFYNLFINIFYSDVSVIYFCSSVEWYVARRKHSHFGLCGGQSSDHRGMPMINPSRLYHSPQRWYRVKFIKYCPLLQAAWWTNKLTG